MQTIPSSVSTVATTEPPLKEKEPSNRRHGFSVAERTAVLLLAYCGVFLISHWLSFQLRFDFAVDEEKNPAIRSGMQHGWVLTLPVKLVALFVFRQFSGMIGFFSLPDLWRVFYAVGSSSGLLLVAGQVGLFPEGILVPRGCLLIDFLLSTAGVVAVRVAFRVMRERLRSVDRLHHTGARRVAILGAGDVGASLAKDLLSRRGLGLIPVAFLDDDPLTWRSQVHGIPVLGRPELLRDPSLKLQIDEAIIAMPSAPAKRIGEIVRLLQQARVKFETVPSLDQLATGKVRVSQLRPVEIADLLPREPINIETDNIRQLLADRVVLVTGAGGSIGSELCRQIATYNPRSLLLVEQSEAQLYQIEQELLERGHGGTIIPLVASVLDEARMRYLFQRFAPELLFHAAAHKHVPMMESQPSEALKNNAFGTALLARLALEFKVGRFVLISSDKAINPTSVMGASKRLAEIYLQALHASNHGPTKYMAVRFGNVLGSSGSVIPMFTKQIARGGPVTVTHPDVTRYFMTIPEAVGLVLQSAALGNGGEIFVLDMGRPVKIVDLARQLIMLSGLRPDDDIEIKFTGLRPGEKLFEELSYKGEDHQPTSHPKIMRFVCQARPLPEVQAYLDTLASQLHTLERNQLKLRIQEMVTEYKPYLV